MSGARFRSRHSYIQALSHSIARDEVTNEVFDPHRRHNGKKKARDLGNGAAGSSVPRSIVPSWEERSERRGSSASSRSSSRQDVEVDILRAKEASSSMRLALSKIRREDSGHGEVVALDRERPATVASILPEMSQFEEILPSATGRSSGGRSANVLWQQKQYLGYGLKKAPANPPGVRNLEMIESEAARVFGNGEDVTNFKGVGKYVQARAFELQLAEIVAKGRQILEVPPLSEARKKFYSYVLPKLFEMWDDVTESAGPFQKVLSQLRDQIHGCCYSDESELSTDATGAWHRRQLSYVEVVSHKKREAEKLSATLQSAAAANQKADKDEARLVKENRDLEAKIMLLERQFQIKDKEHAEMQETLRKSKEEFASLKGNFSELQRGFLLGQLQDEMKELLLEGLAEQDDSTMRESMEEQSAMQRMVQQLKDAREAMLHAKDDMSYWKSKYEGMEARVQNLTSSFQDTQNSLDLTKEKMLNMVPAAVHVALKDRYSQVLQELNRVTSLIHTERKKGRSGPKLKERPPDDWKHYVDDSKEHAPNQFQALLGKTGVEDVSDDGSQGDENDDDEDQPDPTANEMDDNDSNVPKEFVDSVALQREKLNQSYKHYRRMHGMSVVTWMHLKNMTLAEFAKLEEDCFAKSSIWALALLREA